jgi:hypothetical protein
MQLLKAYLAPSTAYINRQNPVYEARQKEIGLMDRLGQEHTRHEGNTPRPCFSLQEVNQPFPNAT